MNKQILQTRWNMANILTEDTILQLNDRMYTSTREMKPGDRILVGFFRNKALKDEDGKIDSLPLITFHIEELDTVYDLQEDVVGTDYEFPILDLKPDGEQD